MVKCPSKILNDPNIKTDEERKELCKSHYDNKPKIKPKPSPDKYCPKIKTKKGCDGMKKCVYKDGKCSKKKLIKERREIRYDGPHENKYLEKYTKKFKSKKYNTLNNAQKNSDTDNTVGGITKSKKGKFTIRTGNDLKNSKFGEISWIKKILDN